MSIESWQFPVISTRIKGLFCLALWKDNWQKNATCNLLIRQPTLLKQRTSLVYSQAILHKILVCATILIKFEAYQKVTLSHEDQREDQISSSFIFSVQWFLSINHLNMDTLGKNHVVINLEYAIVKLRWSSFKLWMGVIENLNLRREYEDFNRTQNLDP